MVPSGDFASFVKLTLKSLPESVRKYAYLVNKDIIMNRAMARKKYNAVKSNTSTNEYTFGLIEGYVMKVCFDTYHSIVVAIEKRRD